jgi:hypothetical protein
MQLFAIIVYFLAVHRFTALVGFIVLPIILGASTKAATAPGSKKHFTVASLTAPLFIYGFVNVFLGTFFAVDLVHAFGQPGQATITGSYDTSTQYNNHNVVGYHVLIATTSGRTVETSFEDDDFIVYPLHNATTYPETGDHFNVRYLSWVPSDFIIIANDDSPWANALRCSDLRGRMSSAENKFNFNNSDASYRADAIRSIQAYVSGPCGLSDEDRQNYQQDIDSINNAH